MGQPGNLPFVNLFYLRPATDYLFLNALHESLSPGYLRRQERNRARDYGQFACTKDHPKSDGASIRLMGFGPGSNSDRDLTFAVRAGRILQTIWVGGRDGPIIDKLEVDRRHGSVTDDVFFLIVMSRWAIARACLATMDGPSKDGLGKILQATAVKIYQASSRYGPLDAEAEYRFIAKLDAALGFTEAETSKLIRDCRRFAAMVAGRAAYQRQRLPLRLRRISRSLADLVLTARKEVMLPAHEAGPQPTDIAS